MPVAKVTTHFTSDFLFLLQPTTDYLFPYMYQAGEEFRFTSHREHNLAITTD